MIASMPESAAPEELDEACVTALYRGFGGERRLLGSQHVDGLARAIAGALAAYQGIEIDRLGFAEHLGACLTNVRSTELVARLEALRVDEVYLAYAASQGSATAQRIIEAEFFDDAKRALGSLGVDGAHREDVWQRVRTTLFGTGAPNSAKLATFRGVGPLRRWIRITAVRSIDRRPSRQTSDEGLLAALPDLGYDPELAGVAQQTRDSLRTAFEAALKNLDARDRTVLKQSVLDGLSIDALAHLHGVHRATSARWLARIRQGLLDATKGHLGTTLKISLEEVESLVRVAQSQLDLTLERIIGDADSAD